MWDGAFSLARTMNSTNEDAKTYQKFVLSAVCDSLILQCPITTKVHMLLRHVKQQTTNIRGGLGDKMEDWVERLHQLGMQQHRRFAQYRTPLFAHSQERRQALATLILMRLLKWMQWTN